MIIGENDAADSARTLADEYAQLASPGGERMLALVARRWGDRSQGDQRQLAQILMIVLEPLNRPGARVTDDLRQACEATVADWVRKTIPVADLVGGRPVPGPVPASRGRLVRLVWADAPTQEGAARARVTVETADGQHHAATVPCRPDTEALLKAGAQATVQALRQALSARSVRMELRDVTTFDAFQNIGVIVAVAVTDAGGAWTAVGTCPDVGGQPVRAAALAVLNATNRRLGIG